MARLHHYGPQPAADIATTLLARGEFALILAAMAASAGLDSRLAAFIAGYVLVLAVLGPIVAGRSHWLVRALAAARTILPGRRDRTIPEGEVPSAGTQQRSAEADAAPAPVGRATGR